MDVNESEPQAQTQIVYDAHLCNKRMLPNRGMIFEVEVGFPYPASVEFDYTPPTNKSKRTIIPEGCKWPFKYMQPGESFVMGSACAHNLSNIGNNLQYQFVKQVLTTSDVPPRKRIYRVWCVHQGAIVKKGRSRGKKQLNAGLHNTLDLSALKGAAATNQNINQPIDIRSNLNINSDTHPESESEAPTKDFATNRLLADVESAVNKKAETRETGSSATIVPMTPQVRHLMSKSPEFATAEVGDFIFGVSSILSSHVTGEHNTTTPHSPTGATIPGEPILTVEKLTGSKFELVSDDQLMQLHQEGAIPAIPQQRNKVTFRRTA